MTTSAPLGLMTFAQINAPPTADQWNDQELDAAATLGLPTTSWQQGSTERTIFAVVANMMAQADVAGSIVIQAGFLTFAAFGSVTFIDASGATQTFLVTPDPSIPAQNPTGALGWLDVLADGLYNVRRILVTPAGGTLAILNTQATTYGPFDPGTYHVAQPAVTGAPTYANTATLSIPQSSVLGTVTGTASAGGLVKLTATGVWTVGQTVFVDGLTGTTEGNGAWIVSATDGTTFITLAGSTFVHAWVSGGIVYAPTLAAMTADVPGTSSDALAPNLVNHPVTSLIGVKINNVDAWLGSDTESNAEVVIRCRAALQSVTPNGPKGAYLFYALSSIQLAPTLNPPQKVSTAVTRALVTQNPGTGAVVVTLATASGAPTEDDRLATDAVIQAYAVPVAVSETTVKATERSITIAVTIYVPIAFKETVKPIVQVASQTYFRLLPIAGVSDPGGATNVVPFEGVRGAIEDACAASLIPVQDLHVTLDGGSGPAEADVQLLLTPTPEVAVLQNPNFSVNSVPI